MRNLSGALLFLFVMLMSGGDRPVAAGNRVDLTVNATSDGADLKPGDGVCDAGADPGDQCSLRAALEEINAHGFVTPAHSISFAIAGIGPFIIAPLAALPPIEAPVFIDGSTQPGAACPAAAAPATLLIVLDGSSAPSNTDGLFLDGLSSGSAIRGLAIGGFDGDGIYVSSNNNLILCNHIGIGADGQSALPNDSSGIFVSGRDNRIGLGTSHAARNVISGNGGYAIQLYGSENKVANNFIGTAADGQSDLGNDEGINVSADANLIGGDAPEASNIIGYNNRGIYVSGVSATVIQGNLIGVGRDGLSPAPNGSHAITLAATTTATVVGGTGPGEGNVIAYSGGAGVLVLDGSQPATENQISGNAIYANVELGIDLGGDGADTNDAGDVDEGPNRRQNTPVLLAASFDGRITGTLSSAASASYQVEFFLSISCDSGGYGEGRQFLTPSLVTTNGAGSAPLVIDLGRLLPPGRAVTATATDANGNTSEFSACIEVDQAPYRLLLPFAPSAAP